MIRFYFHPTPNPAKVAERHYEVLDTHLKGREFIVGNEFTIADISAWGWLDRAARVLPGDRDPLAAFPNVKRLFQAVDSRPAVNEARAVGKGHAFKKEVDEETKRALFPSNTASPVVEKRVLDNNPQLKG